MTAALILLALNRLADGLDGAVARAQTPSELGAYLDIVSDFVLWGLLPIGFIILDSDNAIAAAVLLSSFSMSMTVFLAFAIMAEKRGLETDAQGTNFSMLPALLKVQKPSRFSPLSLSGRVRLFRRLLSMRALCICLSSGGSPAAISFKRTALRHISSDTQSGVARNAVWRWLGWQDSNLRMAIPKTAALPLGYTPTVGENTRQFPCGLALFLPQGASIMPI